MRRRLALVFAAAFLSACGRSVEPGAPRYETRDCRRVDLVDVETGRPVVGAEDLRVDPPRGRLVVSAYDRRAAEGAAKTGAASVPEGGLYAVDLAALKTAGRVDAKPLVERAALAGGLRPHGLFVDPADGRIAFVNRSYMREGGRWRLAPEIVVADAAGRVAEETPARCAANAVVLGAAGVLTSFDHRSCGWRAGFEDVFGGGRTGVAGADGGTRFARARFANGLAETGDGGLALAATRERAVLLLAPGGDGTFTESRKIRTPGGPDNVTVNEQGALVVAVHPSLWRLALQRKLGIGRAPSRIVEIDAVTGKTRLLFDDRRGALLAGATGAVEHEGMLYAGSAVDRGLLVCEGPRE